MLSGVMADGIKKHGGNDQFVSSSSDGISMSSVDNLGQAMHRIASLQTISMEDLVVFFHSKEGQSEVKDSFVLDNEVIRAVAIVGFGKLLLLAWETTSKSNIENILRFSSLSEAIRRKEDFSDFTYDVLKCFCEGIIGKATAVDPQQPLDDSPICVRGYCETLNDLLLQFNSSVFEYDKIVDSILGVPNGFVKSKDRRTNDAIFYLPLIKRVVGGLFRNGGHFLLIERWRSMSWCYEYTRLLSQLFLLLLGEASNSSTILDFTLLEKGNRSVLADSCIETSDSRGGSSSSDHSFRNKYLHSGVHINRIVEEWVVGCLLQQMASVDVFESVAALGEALSFTSSSSSSYSDSSTSTGTVGLKGEVVSKVSSLVIQHCIRLLRLVKRARGIENIPDQNPSDSTSFLLSVRARLIAYIFLAVQCPFLSPYFSFDICLVFEMICTIDNDVTCTVLIAQGVSFLLHPASTSFTTLSASYSPPCSSSFSSSANLLKQKLELVFSHPFILPYLISTTHRRTSESFRARFLASLCVGMERLLEKYCIEIKLLASEIDDFNTIKKEKKEKIQNDSLMISLANLLNLLSSVPLILSTFGRCIYWPIEGFHGEAGQLAFISLTARVIAISYSISISLTSPLSSSTSSSSSLPLSVPDNSFNCPLGLFLKNFPPAILESNRSILSALIIELGDAIDVLELTLTTGWAKFYAETFSLAACIELVYVLLMYRTQRSMTRSLRPDSPGSSGSKIDVEAVDRCMRIKILFVIFCDVTSGLDGSSDQYRGNREKLDGGGSRSSFILPGGLVLGQQLQSTSTIAPTSTTVIEMMEIFERICIHSDEVTSEVCRGLVHDILVTIKGQGSLVTERVNLLLQRLAQRAENKLIYDSSRGTFFTSIYANERRRQPILSKFCSRNQSEISIFTPKTMFGDSSTAFQSADVDELVSDENANRRVSTNGENNVLCVGSIEVFTLIQNVFIDNFRVRQEDSSMQQTRVLSQLESPLLNEEHITGIGAHSDTIWTQVSGSGDLLNVLVSSPIQENEFQPSVLTISVNITNTSGFKISAFFVSIVLILPEKYSSAGGVAACVLPTVPTGGVSTLIDSNNMIEYMLPGAMVQKIFYIEVKRLSALDVVVRLSYPDLGIEESDSGDTFFSFNKNSGQGQDGVINSDMRGGAGRAEVVTSETDCAPFHVDVTSFMKPFGNSSLSALKMINNEFNNSHISQAAIRGIYKKTDVEMGGNRVSFGVFISLWDRLTFTGFIACQDYLTSVEYCNIMMMKETSIPSSLSSCRVQVPSCIYHSEVAWAMQTLWGSFIAVRVEWNGDDSRIIVRCSDSDSLSAILIDSPSFLHALF